MLNMDVFFGSCVSVGVDRTNIFLAELFIPLHHTPCVLLQVSPNNVERRPVLSPDNAEEEEDAMSKEPSPASVGSTPVSAHEDPQSDGQSASPGEASSVVDHQQEERAPLSWVQRGGEGKLAKTSEDHRQAERQEINMAQGREVQDEDEDGEDDGEEPMEVGTADEGGAVEGMKEDCTKDETRGDAEVADDVMDDVTSEGTPGQLVIDCPSNDPEEQSEVPAAHAKSPASASTPSRDQSMDELGVDIRPLWNRPTASPLLKRAQG